MTNDNDTPADSRVPRPRDHQASKDNSNGGTFRDTMISPLASREGTMVLSPAGTTYDSSSALSSAAVQVVDPSMIAVRGSAPASPILRARRGLKDSGYFNRPSTKVTVNVDSKDTSEHKTLDDFARSGSIDESVEFGNAQSQIQTGQAANTGRVIAIDCNVFVPAALADSSEPSSPGRSLSVLNNGSDIGSPVSPTEKKEAASGLLLALRQLHSLGHPLHLVGDKAGKDSGSIMMELARLGITIGTRDKDVVAAIWFADSTIGLGHGEVGLGPRRQDSMGMGKLKILRAMNAALYLSRQVGLQGAITSAAPRIPIIQVGASEGNPATNGDDGFDGSGIVKLSKWTEIIAWVRKWDEAM